MELVMVKAMGGALLPMDDGEADKAKRWKAGAVVRGEFTEMRNGKFFRKFWALAKLAYEMWADELPELEYKGEQVRPEFSRFRRDLVVLAGYFTPVYAADGTVRLDAKSISWAKMKEPEFELMYSQVINVILAKVLKHKKLTEAQLRAAVDSVIRFDS